jgi:hypothetical protein
MTIKIALVVALAAGCANSSPDYYTQEIKVPAGTTGGGGTSSTPPTCKSVTVSGNAWYNDQRTYGRFSIREDQSGNAGRQYRLVNATPDDDDGDSADHGTVNYLGLYDATILIHEFDTYFSRAMPGCYESEVVGSTTVNSDGSWSWTGQVCDSCTDDDAFESNGVSLAVSIALSYCPSSHERCFSVNDPGAWRGSVGSLDNHDTASTTWERWYANASLVDGHQKGVTSDGAKVNVGSRYFQDSAGSFHDHAAQAALVFASLVDTTRKVHTEGGVPFRYDGVGSDGAQFGSVRAFYPQNFDFAAGGHSHESTGVTHSNLLCLPAPGSTHTVNGVKTMDSDMDPEKWWEGDIPMHEYGHIVNYRAWDGRGKDVDYNLGGATGEQDPTEWPSAALKENWADFIARVTVNDENGSAVTLNERGCDNNVLGYDDDITPATATCFSPNACALAVQSPGAVEHVLCDWFDTNVDDSDKSAVTPFLPAWNGLVGESASASLSSIVSDLKKTWTQAPQSRRDLYLSPPSIGVQNGFTVCDLAATHGGTLTFNNMLLHNGLDCGLLTYQTTEIGQIPSLSDLH